MLVFLNGTKDQMILQAVKDYPEECCGVLVGQCTHGIRNVTRVIPVRNEKLTGKSTGFAIEPLVIMEIEEEAVENGQEIIGFYHSHPDYRAELSTEDEKYMIPDLSYPIMSVQKGSCRELVSYVKKSQREEMIFREETRKFNLS